MGIEKNTDEKTELITQPKPKRIMTEAQKQSLALGRQKAHERMRNLKADKEELEDLRKAKDSLEIPNKSMPEVIPKLVKNKVKEEKSATVIEKHYYHNNNEPAPIPPAPIPPAPAPQVVSLPVIARPKKKILFK